MLVIPLCLGDYWIDPNEGSHDDAILVHCNATNYETCIYPRWATVSNQNKKKNRLEIIFF